MAGGIGPPQDSTRRALVGTSHKIPATDEAWFYELRFVPWHKRDEPVAVSRVYDERLRRPGLRSRLAPDTCGPKGLDNAAAIIDGSGYAGLGFSRFAGRRRSWPRKRNKISCRGCQD